MRADSFLAARHQMHCHYEFAIRDLALFQNGPDPGREFLPALVERGGAARAFPVENVKASTLKNEIAVNVAKQAIIMTDESSSYPGLREQPRQHRTVRHTAGEYARMDSDGVNVHTNTAESFFALLKRGHYGIFHQISKKHLHRYCNEFGFRWNQRKVTDGERIVAAINGVEGKRLMYRQPTGGLVG